jgi:hypothetical protein
MVQTVDDRVEDFLERVDHVNVSDRAWRQIQAAPVGDSGGATVGIVAARDRPLGEFVAAVASKIGYLVQQQVQRSKRRAMKIPMSLLGQQTKIDQVAQRRIDGGYEAR